MTDIRHADLQTLAELLKQQDNHKLDMVVPASALRFRDATLRLRGLDSVQVSEAQLTDSGVTAPEYVDPNGTYELTDRALATLADKLGVSLRDLRRFATGRPDVFDGMTNALLHGKTVRKVDGTTEELYPADDRNLYVRTFVNGDQPNLVRAFLSDRYNRIDHLDVLTAVLRGIKAAGVDAQIHRCNLGETYMSAQVYSPQVAAMAPTLLANYRNPFADAELERQRQELARWRPVAEREGLGYEAGSEPVVFAGFEFSNDECGAGSFTIQPKLMVRVCKNGLTLPIFARRKVHAGVKLDQGIQWSTETTQKALELIVAQTRDAVVQWLSQDFLNERVQELEVAAGAPVTEPEKAIKVIAKEYGFSEFERDGVLAHFIRGGQMTAAGVANAITSFSQLLGDAERADALDAIAVSAMMKLSR